MSILCKTLWVLFVQTTTPCLRSHGKLHMKMKSYVQLVHVYLLIIDDHAFILYVSLVLLILLLNLIWFMSKLPQSHLQRSPMEDWMQGFRDNRRLLLDGFPQLIWDRTQLQLPGQSCDYWYLQWLQHPTWRQKVGSLLKFCIKILYCKWMHECEYKYYISRVTLHFNSHDVEFIFKYISILGVCGKFKEELVSPPSTVISWYLLTC